MEKEQKAFQAGDKYEIPVSGSLGLLALGYKGVKMWREVRDKAKKEALERKSKEGDKK